MLKALCLTSVLLLPAVGVAQVNAPPAPAATDNTMQLPPPVSSVGIPTGIGANETPNLLRGSIAISGGYVSNLYPGTSVQTLNDAVFSLRPEVSLDRTVNRLHLGLQYTPTFTYYDPDSSLNSIDHNAVAAFSYRASPNVSILANDTFTKTSDTLSQPLPSGAIPGSLTSGSAGLVIPFSPQISNSATAQVNWQFSPQDMLGVGGNSAILHFTSPSLSQGLYDSTLQGGFAFYTRRVSLRQYIGGTYQYSTIAAAPVIAKSAPEADLEAHNFLGFYTIYFDPKLSVSVGTGTQHYDLTQGTATAVHSWAPIALASIGWQASRASLALSYTRVVTEGDGVLGAYTSNSATMASQLQPTRNWIAGVNASYSQLSPVTRSVAFSVPGGHSLSAGGTLERQFGRHLSLSFQYQHLHQNYDGIPSIKANPDNSQETLSLSYHFSKPLGK